MLHSESMKEIAPALVKAWKAMPPAIQDAVNPHYKSHYATLGAVLEAVRTAFLPNDLCLIQSCEQSDDAGVTVTTTALHISGEWVSCPVRIPLEKASANGVGSAISYGKRYGAGAIAALWSEADDDGTVATQYERPTAAPKAESVSQAPRSPAPAAPTASSTPKAAPTASSTKNQSGAFSKLMPFGKFKGTALGSLEVGELRNTASWCRDKDTAKFQSLIDDCETVAAAKDEFANPPAALEPETDEIPF